MLIEKSMDTELLKWAQSRATLFRTFNNASRILIMYSLRDREMSVSDIAAAIEATVQNTSQHLQVMKDRGILASRREGQTIYYRVVDCSLLQQCGLIAPHVR
jgi:ArsR family transcriptional regulator, virulence genes transcriptional regulator